MTFQTQRLFDNVFNINTNDRTVSYWYEGYCPNTGKLLVSLFIRAPDFGFLKPLCSKARFFVFEPARKICDTNGKLLRLPRTDQIEAIARELMQSLAEDPIFSKEGKMYGAPIQK
jgi:hypothetical protein